MRDKGRFRDFNNGLPVTAVVDPDAGLFSSACRPGCSLSRVGHRPEQFSWDGAPRIGQKVVWTSGDHRQPRPASASARPWI